MFRLLQPFYEEDNGTNITGGNVEEIAEPQESLDTEPNEQDNSEVVDPKPVQSQEDNARFAAARREAEAEKKRLMEENEQMAKDLGYENYAEFRAEVKRRKDEQEKQAYINEYGIDPDSVKPLVEKMLQEHPAFKEIEAEKIKTRADAAINDLNKAFPDLNVKTVEDVQNLPNFQEIYNLCNSGYTLVNAYKVANFDTLVNKTSAAAKQQALNQINGKSHVKPNGQGADINSGPMPDDETLRMYRRMNPGKSDEFYIAHYRKSLQT